MANNVTLTELIDMLSELFTNMNNLDKTYYDMFYNPTPLDITLERYDENGVLQKVVLPNRAKDKDAIIVGSGDPEGKIAAGIGKLYMDGNNSYLYYKTQGTALAPTVSGWMLIFTTINAGTTFQLVSEKGQANGYAPLNENKKVPAEFLEATELTYYDTKQKCFIEIALKTILTWACTNTGLDFDVFWTGTDPDIGVRTVELTESTLTEHPLNDTIVTKTGDVQVNVADGVATGFDASNYLQTSMVYTNLNFTTGTVNQVDETLVEANGNKIIIKASATQTTVTTNREELKVNSTFTGVKPIGTQEDVVSFKDKLEWHNAVCTKQGELIIDNVGDVTGFSSNNYLAPTSNWHSSDTLDITFTTGSDITTGQAIIGNNMSVAIKDGHLGYNKLTDKTFAPVVEISASTVYHLQISYDSAKESNVVKYSLDGVSYTEITPAEAGNLFLLGTWAIGKGILDGESNVPFLGSVQSTDCAITTGGVKTTFSEVTQKWYNQADIATTLDAHDLAIESGTPQNGDVVTVNYVTSKPMINSNEVELGATYNFKFVLDEEDPYTFYPQVEINGEWVSAGDAVRVDNTEMNIGKGVFNGSINLLQSTQDVTQNVVTKNYTEVGTLLYNLGVAGGFSDVNYIDINTPQSELDLVLRTGATVTTGNILDNPGSVANNLYLSPEGVVTYTNAGTATATNLTVTANTSYDFKCVKAGDVWGIQFSTDKQTWTDLAVGESKDFTSLFTGAKVAIGQGFEGTVDVSASKVDSIPMYTLTRQVTEVGATLARTVITYRWMDAEGVEQDLTELGLDLKSGTPVTGDILTLTYTTTEF